MNAQHQCTKVVPRLRLAKPYLYRRHGVYYLKVRPVGSLSGVSISLRSSSKANAMLTVNELSRLTALFQLDNPDAQWEGGLKETVVDFANELLGRKVESHELSAYYNHFEDHISALSEIASTHSLNSAHAMALQGIMELLKMGQNRLQGRPWALGEVAAALNEGLDVSFGGTDVLQGASLSSSVRGPKEPHHLNTSARINKTIHKTLPKVSFRTLADSYQLEHKDNIKASTLKGLVSTYKVLDEAFEACGVTDLSNHSRADLSAVKAHLSKDRSPSTVNKYLTTLSTVLTWAMDNGLIKVNYSKRLKTLKGTSSDRKAFSQEQVDSILDLSRKGSGSSLAGWACSLAAVTGARQQEVLQLAKEDIIVDPVTGGVSISINEGSPWKSVKNAGSIRTVPVVASSRWFPDLAAFLEHVKGLKDGERLFSQTTFDRTLRLLVRAAVGDNKDLVFHSFRHTLSSLLQAHEVSLQTAAAILGHTTGSVTFDTYGSAMGQATLRAALEKVLPI